MPNRNIETAPAGVSRNRRVIVVAPHFPPSNLASVHRSRLFAKHLPHYGWEPIIVTVHHQQYEEALDWNLAKLVPQELRVERVRALPTRPLRIVGDIGIRGFVGMLRRIIKIIDSEPVDLLYITVPSFYAALLGPLVHLLRGIPYGIDYIDPWVYLPTSSEKRFSKAWISRQLARLLEPLAVRWVSLITGVAEGYYRGVLERNPRLSKSAVTAAMPYGGDRNDHERIRELALRPYLFDPTDGRLHLLYAGAMLPHAVGLLDAMFEAVAADATKFSDICFHFVGTGRSPSDPNGFNIRPLAERHGLWPHMVTEHPARIPYLDVLVHLEAADAAFILGSTEPHYTPSKLYQAILAGKPIFAILHEQSSACRVIQQTGVGQVLAINAEAGVTTIRAEFSSRLEDFRQFIDGFDPSNIDMAAFEEYSARSVTGTLSKAMNQVLAGRESPTGIRAISQDRQTVDRQLAGGASLVNK